MEELAKWDAELWAQRCDTLDMLVDVPGEQKYPSPELISLPVVSLSVSAGVS